MPRKKKILEILPVIPLRGMMVFPHMVLHFDVARAKSVAALEQAMMCDQKIFLVAQRDSDVEDPTVNDLYSVGTIATIKQVMNLPGDSIRVLVEGKSRATIEAVPLVEPYIEMEVMPNVDVVEDTVEMQAMVRATQDFFTSYAKASQRITPDTVNSLREVNSPDKLADIVAANVLTSIDDRMKILEELDVMRRLEAICGILARETELVGVEKQVQARIKKQIEKNQKEHYLREQIKAIQTELGGKDFEDTDDLKQRMDATPLNEEAQKKCAKEIERLSRMAPGSPEMEVSRNYIEWILDLPWGEATPDNLDLSRARKVLAEQHYGLEKVKERIIEYLAVLKIKQDMKGPILCFVGPPGVGKTSIVKSIASAIGRNFVQMSLGGVRDEAEIRGHRRTYIGSIPGRIIAGIKQAKSVNPVFLFDEIDKLGSDHRGDPASALLEVLDAEQNHSFRDHYLELPFDLSQVMFITTANTTDSIPAPLLDRMELIEVPSYTEEEKLQIGKLHLLPKQIEAHGLKPKSVKASDRVLRSVIEGYTREAGVRTLERTIAKLVRKAAVTMVDQQKDTLTISLDMMKSFLGAARYTREAPEKEPRIGVVNGLAYTSVGGELLEVECSIMPGKGNLRLTGQLGDVMKESAEAAFSWVRAHTEQLNLPDDFYQTKDIHIHVPEGAVPKDGPSAGVTMTTALASALTGIPVRQDVAMTGEVTLRGRVLPIGGLKEKSMAAYRASMKTLIIPKENVKDLEEIPVNVLSSFRVVTADVVEDVLRTALVRMPEKREERKSGD